MSDEGEDRPIALGGDAPALPANENAGERDPGEELLVALGKAIREGEGLPEGKWEQLARGELSPDEEKTLKAGTPPPVEEGEASLYEMVRPPDRAETRRQTEALWAKSRYTARAPRKIKRAPWGILLAAALAGIGGATAMWVLIPGPNNQPLFPALPRYALSIRGGAATVLGDPPATDPDAGAADVIRFDRSMHIALRLVPEARMTGSLKARVWLARGGEARQWQVALSMAGDGSFSTEGEVEALFRDVPDGAWEMVLVVSVSDALADDEALRARIARGERAFGPGTSVAVQRIVLEERHGLNTPPAPGPRIELGGCAAVRAPRTCAVKEGGSLRVWFGTRYAENVTIDLGGEVLPLSGTALQGGLAFDVPIPSEKRAGTLTLTGRGQGAGSEQKWRLAAHETPAVPSRLDKLRTSARAALSREEVGTAVPLFEEAITMARAEDRASEEVSDRLALSYAQLYAGHPDAAEAALVGIEESADPEASTKAAFYRGLLAYEQVRLPQALGFFVAAEEGAERLALVSRQREAVHMHAVVLAELGRADDADRLFGREAKLDDGRDGPCDRIRRRANRGWVALVAARGDEAVKQAVSGLQQTANFGIARMVRAELLEEELSRCAAVHAEALTNLAFGYARLGNGDSARAALERARSVVPEKDARLARWWKRLEAMIALRDGGARGALVLFDALSAEARRDDLPDMAVESALGRADALLALGRDKDAGAAYVDADRRLQSWSDRVPLGEGRDSFVSLHAQVSEARVSFAVGAAMRAAGGERESLTREAASLARRSLSRYAATIGLFDRTGVSQTGLHGEADVSSEGALPTIGEGEVMLAAHRTRSGWALFAVEPDGAAELATESGDSSASTLGEKAASLFAGALQRARRVRLSAWGAMAGKAPEALRGRVLSYGLDVPGAPETSAPPERRSAWVVLDPERDAQATRESGPAIAKGLAEAGFRVSTLRAEGATLAAIKEALSSPETTLFHYGGHGVQVGADGLEAHLRLAGGEKLTAKDILALPRVPPWVVLLGCETGRPSSEDAGLGLAQAFLLRGARVVVASDRPVRDATAAAVAGLLYTEEGATAATTAAGATAGAATFAGATAGTRNVDLDLPARLHRAQIELSQRLDDVWTLRALVR